MLQCYQHCDAITVISVSYPGCLALWCPYRRPSCLPVARPRACSRPLRGRRGDLSPSPVRSGCLWVGSAGVSDGQGVRGAVAVSGRGAVVVNHEGIVKALATGTPGPSRRRRPCGPCDQAPTQLTGADLILIHMPRVTRPLRPRLARIIMGLLFFHGTARHLIPGRTRTDAEHGGLPERPMGADCKSAAECYGGSNPSPATMVVLLRQGPEPSCGTVPQ